jgi:flagellar biosynthesis/type III secretory pathway protein FliH
MGMWQNHRARQAGKYQKVVAQQQAQLLRQQVAMSQPAHTQATWQAGYEQARADGWLDGWRAGQADLINALKTGRVRWEDISR